MGKPAARENGAGVVVKVRLKPSELAQLDALVERFSKEIVEYASQGCGPGVTRSTVIREALRRLAPRAPALERGFVPTQDDDALAAAAAEYPFIAAMRGED